MPKKKRGGGADFNDPWRKLTAKKESSFTIFEIKSTDFIAKLI